LGLVGLGALIWRLPRLRGTTLVAPWAWSLVALAGIVGTELAIGWMGTSGVAWLAQARFAAATGTFCPVMALLGAKRPQNGPWQFVVFSLWLVLSLASIEWLLFGGAPEIHPARLAFLLILVGTGAVCGVGTRFWPSSLLFAAGQIAILSPIFAGTTLDAPSATPFGLAAIVCAWLLLAADWPAARQSASPLDRLWLDFRDALGAAWALRVAQRMNASAKMQGWPVWLGWNGFERREGGQIRQVPDVVEESFRAILGRFLSPEWIDARLAQASRGDAMAAQATASGR
jgi:hypothetical protein